MGYAWQYSPVFLPWLMVSLVLRRQGGHEPEPALVVQAEPAPGRQLRELGPGGNRCERVLVGGQLLNEPLLTPLLGPEQSLVIRLLRVPTAPRQLYEYSYLHLRVGG